MSGDCFNINNAILIQSENTFRTKLPFKAYNLEGQISGTLDHAHDYMQIWYVCRGMCRHWINDREHRMIKGDLFVIPPYVVHKVRPVEGEDIHIIGFEFAARFIDDNYNNFNNSKEFFDFAYLEPFLVSQDMVKPKFNLSPESQNAVEGIMKDMLREYNKGDDYYEMIIKADLLKLLAIVAREYKNSHKSKESQEILEKYRTGIISAIEYIHENYSDDLHLEDICKYALMSKTNFCYIFKILTSKTFTEYLTHIRVQKALEALLKTDATITQICYDVGFKDVTHFCRTFKKIVGVSPKYYKKSAF